MASAGRRLPMMLFAILAALPAGFLILQRPGAADDAKTPQKVLWSDLGTKVQIIGQLGKPLGEMATIRGRWILPTGLEGPTKDDNPVEFVIDTVDGVYLDPPPRINRYRIGFLDPYSKEPGPLKEDQSVVWEIRAFEQGGSNETPDTAFDEYEKAYGHRLVSPQMPVDGRHACKFCCALTYVTARPVEKLPAK